MADTLVVRRAFSSWLLVVLLVVAPSRAWSLAGKPDPTFDGDGTATQVIPVTDEYAFSIAVQADDKVLVLTADKLLRLATDGSLDPTFDGDGVVDVVAGRIEIVGSFIYLTVGYGFSRYDMNGTLDTSYGTAGILALSPYPFSVVDLTVDSLGRPVGVGSTYDSVLDDMFFSVYRYGLDGNPDPTFGANGKVTTTLTGEQAWDFAYKVVVQPDDKIVALAGSTWDDGGAIDPVDEEETEEGGGEFVRGGSSLVLVRYNTDGSLDTSFSGNGKAIFAAQDAYSEGIALQRMADGKFVAFASVLETVPGDHDLIVLNVARFNADGTLDPTLDGDGVMRSEFPYNEGVDGGIVQPDGKILVVSLIRGEPLPCYPLDFHYLPAIVRFNADGTRDNTYDGDAVAPVAPGYFWYHLDLAVDSLGRAVVSGHTWDDPCVPGVEDTDWIVSRLLPDCTLDGVVTAGESCDDGDLVDGNGCDNTCEVRECWGCTGTNPSTCSPTAAGSSCDDGSICTANDQCDGSGGCTALTPTPLASCIVAEQSTFSIARGATPAKDKIAWSWKDEINDVYDFRDPVIAGTGHTLCIFDGAGTLMQAEIPPGGLCDGDDRCWKTNIYNDYYKFKDRSLAHGGIEQLTLDEDGAFKLKGKGVNVPDSPVLVDPVTVQLIKHDGPTDACFESAYTGNEIGKSTAKGFKGKHKQ
jgi:uncharacterized delta-60 repeat protein